MLVELRVSLIIIKSDEQSLAEVLICGVLLVGHEDGSTGNSDSTEDEVAVVEGSGSLYLSELDGGNTVGTERGSVKEDVVVDVVYSPLEGLLVGGLAFLKVLS